MIYHTHFQFTKTENCQMDLLEAVAALNQTIIHLSQTLDIRQYLKYPEMCIAVKE